MNRKTIAILVLGFVGVVLAAAIASYALGVFTPPGKQATQFVPMQKRPDWAEKTTALRAKSPSEAATYGDRGILLRSEAGREPSLLVKFDGSPDIFRYDRFDKSIKTVNEVDWLSGISEIRCRERQLDEHFFSRKYLKLDDPSGTINIWNTPERVPTYGHYALDVLESPRKDLAVILSADGPRKWFSFAIWGFGGENVGETRGQRYVQVFNIEQRSYISPPLALQSDNRFPRFGFCWDDNDRFVVAYESELIGSFELESSFHVIDINQ